MKTIAGQIKATIQITLCLTLGLSVFATEAEARRSKEADKRAKQKKVSIQKQPLSVQARYWRLQHAKELMGRYYKKSVVRRGEDIDKINDIIYRWTWRSLPPAHRKDYQRVAQAVIDESLKHTFDPIFVMSVIQRESSFNPVNIGGVGEIGLMQIRPTTAAWMAKKAGIKYTGPESLKDPVVNIRIGTAYLAYLREHFDSHARLYLAAYNMGQNNVKKALNKKVWPRDYPVAVMQNYVDYYKRIRQTQPPTQEPVRINGPG